VPRISLITPPVFLSQNPGSLCEPMAHELQAIVAGFTVNENEIRPDVTVAKIFSTRRRADDRH
jgi:hypothetical protein